MLETYIQKEERFKINNLNFYFKKPGEKSGFFDQINKSDKPLANMIKKKREQIEITTMRNEKENNTAGTIDIKRIKREIL